MELTSFGLLSFFLLIASLLAPISGNESDEGRGNNIRPNRGWRNYRNRERETLKPLDSSEEQRFNSYENYDNSNKDWNYRNRDREISRPLDDSFEEQRFNSNENSDNSESTERGGHQQNDGNYQNLRRSEDLNPGSNQDPRSWRTTFFGQLGAKRKENCTIISALEPAIDDTLTLSLWELMEKTEKELVLKEEQKNVVLILGNTGSGKSTITQLLAGNASALEVVNNEEGTRLIIDPEHKIGRTIASKTLVPELVVDPETGVAFYDCPGFSDNRGANLDITVNYLLKRVTDYVTSVKLIFSVVYSNVNGMNEKSGFDNLVTTAVRMINNLAVFESGIGLIATKAPNFDPATADEMEEEELIQNVKTFLRGYKTSQEDLLNSVRINDREIIQKKIELVDILLKENRIRVLQNPKKCGLILNNLEIVENRQSLKKLIGTDLIETPSSPTDYGYALSDAAIIKVNAGIKEINRNITDQTSTLFGKLSKAQREKLRIQEDFDFYAKFISEEFDAFNQTFSGLEQKGGNLNPRDLGNKIKQVLSSRLYDISLRKYYYEKVSRLDSYLSFFNEIISKNATEYSNWIEPFRIWLEDTGKLRDWADYLERVRQQLGKYEFQLNKPNIQVPSYPGLPFVANLIGQDAGKTIRSIFGSGILTTDDKVYLQLILEEALDPVKFECEKDILKISGNYVKASDFTNEDGTYKCKNANTAQVFAARTFFMDRKISPDKSKAHHLSIIAPTWEIVTPSAVAIDLNGKDGPSPYPPKAQTGTAGTGEGQNGVPGLNGVPGKAGNAGGEFFGISNKILKENKLLILVNGGQGGNGQDGGNGANGTKGRAANYANFPSCWWFPGYTNSSYPFNDYFDKIEWWSTLFDQMCIKYGENGGVGGKGGDGGVEGLGGYPGDTQFLQLGETQPITAEIKEGELGKEGRFGNGGIGGERGDTYKAVVSTAGLLGCGFRENTYVNSTGHNSESGSNGTSGANNENRKNPEVPIFTLKKWKIVNDYKALIIRKETGGLRNRFIQILEESKSILNLSHPEAFAHELLNVEEYALKMRQENKIEEAAILLMGRYESFIKRVEDYAKNHITSLSIEDKKVLAITYTTALSSKNSYKNLLGTSVIINVEGYFQNVLNKFERMKDTQMLIVVDEERKQYASKFQEKVMQAMSFVKNVVHPEIDKLEIELDIKSNELLEEIEKVLTEANHTLIDSKEAVKRMKSMKVFRHIFTALKISAAAISLTGPQGLAIGGIIGIASSIAEPLIITEESARKPTPLPPAIKDYGDKLEVLGKKWWGDDTIKKIDDLIKEGEKAKLDNQEAIGGLLDDLEDLKKKKSELFEIRNEPQFFPKLQELKIKGEELNKKLNENMEKFEKASKDTSLSEQAKEQSKKNKKTLEKWTKKLKIVEECGIGIYNDYKNDAAKLDQLEDLVLNAEASVNATLRFKDSVNSTLTPLINRITDNIQKATESMSGKSSVALQVQKWQVKTSLSDFKLSLQTFTEGLSVKDKFTNVISQLSEAVVMTIELYDFIEKYNEQMNFADYLANINSPDALKIVIKNPEIAGYINKIELSLQSNFILAEYDQAIETFKQWVFPYGEIYNNDVELPQGQGVPDFLNPESDIKTVEQITLFLVPRLMGRINKLQERIKEYKVRNVPTIDSTLFFPNFNSEERSTYPFYVWENNKYSETIKDFLSGKKVTFYADSDYSYKRKRSAVKFTIAEFQPKSYDPEIQARLTDILQDFAIEMTHSGVSHYSYDDKTIEMVGENVTLRYNFEFDPKHNNNTREGQNAAYQKMRNGDFILSPYTVWTVQLLKAKPSWDISFDELVKLAPYVDVELVGQGSYVDEKKEQMVVNLETVFYMQPFISQPGNPYVLEGNTLPQSTLRPNWGIRLY